ncbi:hypothetical protein [Thalassospira lucentensis]|uniref:hypothetical protein n=1 Tax=Thalassospira lucentensis TaxID=168935 RepID=UPI003AA8A16F
MNDCAVFIAIVSDQGGAFMALRLTFAWLNRGGRMRFDQIDIGGKARVGVGINGG